jgi:hypothetical protein
LPPGEIKSLILTAGSTVLNINVEDFQWRWPPALSDFHPLLS